MKEFFGNGVVGFGIITTTFDSPWFAQWHSNGAFAGVVADPDKGKVFPTLRAALLATATLRGPGWEVCKLTK